ncbi:hypothetical protein J6590_060619 [Homalodisca vitripennis]|nr:hypothetical protein J6590_060619 [Homalodisca vitripennis]
MPLCDDQPPPLQRVPSISALPGLSAPRDFCTQMSVLRALNYAPEESTLTPLRLYYIECLLLDNQTAIFKEVVLNVIFVGLFKILNGRTLTPNSRTGLDFTMYSTNGTNNISTSLSCYRVHGKSWGHIWIITKNHYRYILISIGEMKTEEKYCRNHVESSHNYTPAARMKLPVDPPSRAGQRFHVASARAANTDWSAAVLAYSNFYGLLQRSVHS